MLYGGDSCCLKWLLNIVVKGQLAFPSIGSCDVHVLDNQDADRSYSTDDCKIDADEATMSTKYGIFYFIVFAVLGMEAGISYTPGKCSTMELLFQSSPVSFNKVKILYRLVDLKILHKGTQKSDPMPAVCLH